MAMPPSEPPVDQRIANATRVLMCAIGLLLTIVQVSAYGVDFANDTIGFGLVCLGAGGLVAGSAHPWWLLVSVSAGLAAVLSLFTYGGMVGQLVPYTYRLWSTLFYLDTIATAGVVIGLALAARRQIQARHGRIGPWLPYVGGIYAVAAGLQVVVFGSESAYGVLGHVRQAVVLITGMTQILIVIVTFLAAGDPALDTQKAAPSRERPNV